MSCGGAIGLTSEHLQSSRWAWRKSRAAFLYFLFSSSASPAEHLSLQAISWLAAAEVDWPLCAVAGRGSPITKIQSTKWHARYHFWGGLCFAVVVQHLLPVLEMDTDLNTEKYITCLQYCTFSSIKWDDCKVAFLKRDLDNVQTELYYMFIASTVIPCPRVHLQSIAVEIKRVRPCWLNTVPLTWGHHSQGDGHPVHRSLCGCSLWLSCDDNSSGQHPVSPAD